MFFASHRCALSSSQKESTVPILLSDMQLIHSPSLKLNSLLVSARIQLLNSAGVNSSNVRFQNVMIPTVEFQNSNSRIGVAKFWAGRP